MKIQVLCFYLEGNQHPGSEPCSRDQPGHSAAQNVTEFHPGKGLLTMAVTQAALVREMNAWSAIHHGSPELSWAEVALQGWYREGWEGKALSSPAVLPATGSGCCPAPAITALHSSQAAEVFTVSYTSENCILGCISPVIFWNMAVLQ